MNRVVLAAVALLLAGRGCFADDQTTTMEERRLMDSTTMADSDMTSAASRTGGLGTVLLALLAFMCLGSAVGAALEESTTMADERRLMDSTTMADSDDMTSAAARSGGLGTVLLALLAFLFVGNAAGAAVDESTTMADERRLMDSTTMADSDTTMADSGTTMAGDTTSPAAPRAAFRTAPLFALAAALGLAARR